MCQKPLTQSLMNTNAISYFIMVYVVIAIDGLEIFYQAGLKGYSEC